MIVVGYRKTVGLLLVPPASALVILYSVRFGPLGWPIALALITAPLYYFNKSRKHGRMEVFDDRLTEERMRAARDEIIADWQKKDSED